MNSVTRLVKIVNSNNFPVYLSLSDNEKDTQVFPPKGSCTMLMTEDQFVRLQKTKLTYNTKG